MSKARSGLWRTYRIPLLLALTSLAGLASALFGDGPFDVLSWIVLSGLIVIVLMIFRR